MDFSETIVVLDVKVGRCSLLNDYMNLYKYQRSRSFIDLGPRSLIFNILLLLLFYLETAKPIEAKFYLYPSWDGGTKVCSNGPGQMTNMDAMHIYGRTFNNLLLWNQKPNILES